MVWLQVAPEERKTVLLTERPYAEPGESNRFQMFGIGKYSKGITPPATDELMVEKQSGGDVVQPMWTVDRSSGVIVGEYRLPKTYSANDGLALRRSAADAKATEQARRLVRDVAFSVSVPWDCVRKRDLTPSRHMDLLCTRGDQRVTWAGYQ